MGKFGLWRRLVVSSSIRSKSGVLVAALALAIAAVTTGPALSASAMVAVRPLTSGCPGNFGTVLLSGSGWLNGSGVNVYSNGSDSDCDSGVDAPPINGVSPGTEWQCVELINSLYLTQGWIKTVWSGNGNQMYANAPASLSKQPQGDITGVAPGDVVSYSYGEYGHAAVVDTVSGDSVTLVNQNAGDTQASVYSYETLSGGSLSDPWSGYTPIGVVDAPGTATGSGNAYETALQTNTGDLWTLGSLGDEDWSTGMMAGTSPSIAALPGGGYEVALQTNTGDLWTVGAGGDVNWDAGMMAGTSPSIAALPGGGYEVAIQTNTGDLWTLGSAGDKDWSTGMMAGTSPSVVAMPSGGYEVALQINTGDLWTLGSGGDVNWDAGMKAGTSPSITALSSGGYEVALQINTGDLWTLGSAGDKDWSTGMMAGTSPSIAAMPGGGYEVALQINTGALWTLGSGGDVNWSAGMMAGTSPSITALSSGGYEVALQTSPGGDLWTLGSGGDVNWGAGMLSGTSPSVTD
jgi:hypothetical protein